MALSDTNRVGWIIGDTAETTWGEAIPTNPNHTIFRHTGGTLSHVKDTVVSETIRSDRSRDFLAEVAVRAEGDMNYELAYGVEFETPLQMALENDTFDVADFTGSAITVVKDGGGTDIARITGYDWTGGGGATLGADVRIKGSALSAGNVGVFNIVAAPDATNLDVYNPDAVSETGDINDEVHQRFLKNGSTQISRWMELQFTDIDEYLSFTGMRIGAMSMNINAQEIINGSWTFSGKEGVAATNSVVGSGTLTTPTQTDQLNATSNAGTIHEGGIVLASAVRSMTININNNPRSSPQIGSKYPADVGFGWLDVTGQLEAYFEDLVMLNKFINHTQSSYRSVFTDAAGNSISVYLPRLYFGSGSPQVPGGNQDVLLPMDYQAIHDGTTGFTVGFNCLPA